VSSDVESALKVMEAKFQDPRVRDRFKGYNCDILFVFSDLDSSYVMKIEGGENVTVFKGSIENPKVKVTTTSDTFIGIINKTMSATAAYMTGKLKVKGPMTDLLKLQYLM
jgi:putative sterol carrier protein